MRAMNFSKKYGIVSILFHWVTAVIFFFMFGLGLWMVELSYFDPWYHRAPNLHKSIGIILFILVVIRILWKSFNAPVAALNTSKNMQLLVKIFHGFLYVLLLTICFSGYLISTSNGRGIDVFNWLKVPSTITNIPQQADISADIHFYLVWFLIGCISLHILGALKHHFIDKDVTLKRIFSFK